MVVPSFLGSLPREIRTEVYKLSLLHPWDLLDRVDGRNVEGVVSFSIDSETTCRPKIAQKFERNTRTHIRQKKARVLSLPNVAVIRTCRAIHSEALPILYGQMFTFDSLLALQTFLFSPARIDLVKSIRVSRINSQEERFMPSVCAILAGKAERLKFLRLYFTSLRPYNVESALVESVEEVIEVDKAAAAMIGKHICSKMYFWVAAILHEFGIERVLELLQIPYGVEGPVYSTGQDDDVCLYSTYYMYQRWSPSRIAGFRVAVGEEIGRLMNMEPHAT